MEKRRVVMAITIKDERRHIAKGICQGIRLRWNPVGNLKEGLRADGSRTHC